jgi:hypothetical protein
VNYSQTDRDRLSKLETVLRNDDRSQGGPESFWVRRKRIAREYASEKQRLRRERDVERGYRINLKQVILAFAVEFFIIGLILVGQYFIAEQTARERVVASQIIRNTNNMSILSAAFSQALSKVQLHGTADGTVRFEPHEIALAANQTISIDGSSLLRLDPNAKVQADGDIKIQLPSVAPSQNSAFPQSRAPLVVNFTVFKHIPFDKGTVVTGWVFLTSKQQAPTQQYCYYTQATNEDNNSDLPGLNVDLNLGFNQHLALPKTLPKGFDASAAFARCVWFRS